MAGGLLANSKILGKIVLMASPWHAWRSSLRPFLAGRSQQTGSVGVSPCPDCPGRAFFSRRTGDSKNGHGESSRCVFAFIPALSGLSLVSGMPVTAGVLHPLVFGMGTVASVFVLDVAFPMIYTSMFRIWLAI